MDQSSDMLARPVSLLLQQVVYWLRAVWRVARSSPALFVLQIVVLAECVFVWGIPFLLDPSILDKSRSYAQLARVARMLPFAPHLTIGGTFCGLALLYIVAAWRNWHAIHIASAFLIATAFSFLSRLINTATPGTTGGNTYFLISMLALWLFAAICYDLMKAKMDERTDQPHGLA